MEKIKDTFGSSATIHVGFGEFLGILGLSIPATLFIRQLYKNHKHWVSRYQPNSVHVDLSTIIKCNQSNKYRLMTRTIYQTKLKDIIGNEHGIKQIHNAIRLCSLRSPFIRLSPIDDQWYLNNRTISAVEQNYRISWFERDSTINNSIQIVQNDMNIDTLGISSEKYIFAMWCPYYWDGNLSHINVNQSYVFWTYLKELFNFDNTRSAQFTISKRIRATFINEQFIETIIREIDMQNISDEEWRDLYDMDPTKIGTSMYHDRILRWIFVKRIIEEYANGNNEWANPLCSVELPIKDNSNNFIKSIDEIDSTNIYHPY
eukprot:183116_1